MKDRGMLLQLGLAAGIRTIRKSRLDHENLRNVILAALWNENDHHTYSILYKRTVFFLDVYTEEYGQDLPSIFFYNFFP